MNKRTQGVSIESSPPNPPGPTEQFVIAIAIHNSSTVACGQKRNGTTSTLMQHFHFTSRNVSTAHLCISPNFQQCSELVLIPGWQAACLPGFQFRSHHFWVAFVKETVPITTREARPLDELWNVICLWGRKGNANKLAQAHCCSWACIWKMASHLETVNQSLLPGHCQSHLISQGRAGFRNLNYQQEVTLRKRVSNYKNRLPLL